MTNETSEEYATRVLEENKQLYAVLMDILDNCKPDLMVEGLLGQEVIEELINDKEPFAMKPMVYLEEEHE